MKALFGILGTFLRAIFPVFGLLFSKLPFCSMAGIISGSFIGFMMSLYQNVYNNLDTTQLLIISLLLGVTGFLLVLLYLGLLLQYGVSKIFWPAAVNTVLTSILTVFITYKTNLPAISGFIGLIIGILVGIILCWLCGLKTRRNYAKT